ncbi:MAG: RNA 3'-terminal phosphate cyclase [Planctomycetes bacterium]|nr:RNA 3'-terminal phosphate cyclase [Planctomycetota bacterium]
MLTIDGSIGEGGGQVLRSAVGMAAALGVGVRVEKIRAGRGKPGLMRQHLTAVRAAARVCGAQVTGDEVGSTAISFMPGAVTAGRYEFAVGTAGSATLVLQTVLPALLTAEGVSELTLEGGTHNPMAPTFDFLAKVFVPAIEQMGPRVEVNLERHGFYPAGGGRMTVRITPSAQLKPIEMLERGPVTNRMARVLVANLPGHIANRELKVVGRLTGWDETCMRYEFVKDSHGPGNVLILELECGQVTEMFTGFGMEGVPAESVAESTVREMRRYMASQAPVGRHLADQLLLPMVLAAHTGGISRFRSGPLSRHALTQIDLLRAFTNAKIDITHLSDQSDQVTVSDHR